MYIVLRDALLECEHAIRDGRLTSPFAVALRGAV